MKAGKTIRWSLIGLISLFVVTAAVLSLPQRANAAVKETLSNSIVKKALASGLRRCYETGAISPRVDKLSSFNSFEDLIIGGADENYVALPNGLTNVSDSAVSCKQLFMGYTLGGGSFEGLFNLAGRKASGFTTNEEKIALLRGMGYESATSGTNKQCVNYIYNYTYLGVPGETATKNVCVTDGKITIEESQSINCGGNDASLACQVPLVFEVSGNRVTIHDHDFDATSESVEYNNNWDDFVKKIERELSTRFSSFDDGTVFYSFNRSNPLSDGGHGDDSYVMKSSAVNNASQYLSLGLATQFSNNEKVTYYVSAIKNWFFDGINLEGGTGTNSYWTCGIKDWNAYGSYTSINANMNGTSGCNCGIDVTKARTTSKIYGISGDSFDASGSTTLDLSSTIVVIDSLVEASPSDTCEPSEDDSAAPIDNAEETGETSNGDTDDVCYGSEGTLGLSWILCPITQMLYDTLDKVYNTVEDNFLQLDSKELLGQKTRDAWQIFQQVANIVFVIFLLVVIFSQLTGIGIDNYGVKKILPRLIICAILVNLSYFIAQILVDISNIIGVGIKNLFESLASGGVASTDPSVVGEGGGYTLMVAGIAIVVATVYANPALLLGFLLTLLTGVISVVMLLAILVAREVGVVVAVIIAPLAFVSYMLPNTSRWLKSWWNLLKGLLIVYPLAAALIGASAFVSGILPSQDNQWMALAAMLVRVVPFFMLPTLFRKSMDAVGNLGTRIQGFGRGINTGLTRRITSGEGYRNLQKTSLERRNRIRAGVNQEGELNALGRARSRLARSGIGRRFGYDNLEAARVARARKAREEDISSAAELGGAIMRSDLARHTGDSRQNYLTRELRDAANAGDTNAFFAALDQAQKSGMKSSDIAKITRRIFNNADDNGTPLGVSWGGSLGSDGGFGNFLQEFANRYSGTFLKKDAEQKSWAATRGGMDVSSAARGGLSGFASRGGMETADLKDNEIIDLSAERLHELLRDGIIDQAQAQRVWSSGANMDSINKLMLGAMGTRGELVNKRDAQAMTSNTYAGGLHGLDPQAVQALTEATPQDTVIRDVRWKNANGIEQQTNPLVTAQSTQQPRDVTFTKNLGNGGRQTKTFQRQPDGRYLDPSSGKTFTEETLRNGGWTNSTP